MAAVAVVVDVQAVGDPADRECRRDTPEETAIEIVVRRVGIVVNGIRARIIVVHRTRLVDDHALGFVIGHVNDVVGNRRYLDDAVVAFHVLVVVATQVAGRIGSVAESLDRAYDVFLLGNYGFAESPRPVDVIVHELDDLGVIEQCDDRVVPIRVRFERRIALELVEEAPGLDHLQGKSRGRQHDGEQVVRIQRDRPDQVFQLGRGHERNFFSPEGRGFSRRLVGPDRLATIVYGYLRIGHGRCRQRDQRECRESVSMLASCVHCRLLTGALHLPDLLIMEAMLRGAS